MCGKVSLFLCTRGGCWRTNICCFCFASLCSLSWDNTPFLGGTAPPLLREVLGPTANSGTLPWPWWLAQGGSHDYAEPIRGFLGDRVALLSSGVIRLVEYMLKMLASMASSFSPLHGRNLITVGELEMERETERTTDCGCCGQISFEDPSSHPAWQHPVHPSCQHKATVIWTLYLTVNNNSNSNNSEYSLSLYDV